MTEQERKYHQDMAAHCEEHGWVAPVTQDDRNYMILLRSVYKRYNINPSKATRLEYEFVTKVAESEYGLQPINSAPA